MSQRKFSTVTVGSTLICIKNLSGSPEISAQHKDIICYNQQCLGYTWKGQSLDWSRPKPNALLQIKLKIGLLQSSKHFETLNWITKLWDVKCFLKVFFYSFTFDRYRRYVCCMYSNQVMEQYHLLSNNGVPLDILVQCSTSPGWTRVLIFFPHLSVT